MQELQKPRQGYKSIKYYGKYEEVPIEWEFTSIAKEFSVYSGSTPSRIHPEYFEGNIPWVSSGELNYDIIIDTTEHITISAVKDANLRIIPKGAFLIAITGLEAAGTRGRCAILGVDATTNQSCISFYNSDRVSTEFIFYFYQEFSERIISSLAQGTKQQSLNLELVKSIKFPLPPINEQKKITDMIFRVDELIQKTDQIIEQTQRLRKGLMQRLLTKGIGHTNFKNTLGIMIPEKWNNSSLEEVSTKIVDMDHKMPKKIDDGIPFLSVAYLTRYETPFLEITKGAEELEYISEDDYNYYSKRFNAEHYDLLISRYGTIGVVRIINTKERLLASYSIALIKLNRNFANPLFMVYFLNSSIVKKQIRFMTQTSSNTNLGVLDIKRLKVCLPCLDEQQKIASVLLHVDSLLQKHQDYKSKLKQLKNALMKELLTGKVRVKT